MESLLTQLKRRTSSTIPFGYELSESNNNYIKPVPEQLDALKDVEKQVINEEISLREGCVQLEHYTGRRISPAGLKKIIDKKYGKRQERLNF
tara:strand:+ start:115 stop:390 length:276 start_codon:yes stop_codon:yes gene_type:complete